MNKKIEVKPIKATTVVYGKYAKAVIEQANTVPSDNFKERSQRAVSLLDKIKG